MSIICNKYYKKQHVTGPGCVLVSLSFGELLDSGVVITKKASLKNSDSEIKFKLDEYISEVIDGVAEANVKHNGDLQVNEIEVNPDDYPTKGQVKYAAFKIAEYLLTNDV